MDTYHDPVSSLIHLYEDGALNRRQVVRRLAKVLGSAAAAGAALSAVGLGQIASPACPANVRVPENDPSIYAENLTISGDGPLFVYQARPVDFSKPHPAVIVIHENQGLTPYIRDVTRRLAQSGYVAVAVDLLSRQGGTDQFTTPETAMGAYGRTRPDERRADMIATLETIRLQPYVNSERVGAIGFCAGGGNVYDLAINSANLSAAAIYYGPPPNPLDQISRVTAPLLLIYPELDRGTTTPLPGVLSVLIAGQKRYALHIYANTSHAFHNDTGPRYDPGAACDAWSKTLAFFGANLSAG